MRPTTHACGRWLLLGLALLALGPGPAAARPTSRDGVSLALAPVAAAIGSPIVFPFVGPPTQWHDDFGEPRPIGHEEGNDIGVDPGTPVVAAVDGRLETMWWGGAGWTIRLTAANGDRFVYEHLGRGGDRPSAFAPGVRDGVRVRQGELIGYSGFSGNASASFPHVEFQYLPGGGSPVSPFALLQRAPRLLFAAPPRRDAASGAATVTLRGVVAQGDSISVPALLAVRVATLRIGAGPVTRPGRTLVLRVPPAATVTRDGLVAGLGLLAPGDRVTIETLPLGPTVEELSGADGALAAAQVMATSAVTV